MRIILFVLLLAFLPLVSLSQTVQVENAQLRIQGENAQGYQVTIAAPEAEVQASLSKYLKMLGKTKQSDGVITLSEPLIGGRKYLNALYATTKQTGTSTTAWLGIHSGTGEEASREPDLEKLIYEFGVSFHRDMVQQQIDESLRALQAVERQQSRLVNQDKDLTSKIENNRRQKIQLENSLVENKLELEGLTQKLESNSKARDSVAVATDQIRKVVEMHKARQRSIH